MTSNTDKNSLKPKFIETLNIVSSLASITGISLLWIKNSIENINWETIIMISLIVPAQISLASSLIWIFQIGYQKFIKKHSSLAKLAYIFISIPLIPIICFMAALITNKIFISINFDWFFSR